MSNEGIQQDLADIKERVIRMDERLNHHGDHLNEIEAKVDAIEEKIDVIDARTQDGIFGSLSNKDLVKIAIALGPSIAAVIEILSRLL